MVSGTYKILVRTLTTRQSTHSDPLIVNSCLNCSIPFQTAIFPSSSLLTRFSPSEVRSQMALLCPEMYRSKSDIQF